MVTAIIPRIVRLVPLLGSPVDNEALGAARAIGRVLHSTGADWHDLARSLERPTSTALPPPGSRRERAPRGSALSAEAVRLLRVGLRLDVFNTWEREFAGTIIQSADRPGWRPTSRQIDIATRLVSRAQEAERHP